MNSFEALISKALAGAKGFERTRLENIEQIKTAWKFLCGEPFFPEKDKRKKERNSAEALYGGGEFLSERVWEEMTGFNRRGRALTAGPEKRKSRALKREDREDDWYSNPSWRSYLKDETTSGEGGD